MTIDLGFARMDLPDGRRVGIVDVPGHERFIRNMVAGATGIDIVILVVAADDGVMPQTREHLAIMDMLGVHRGFVALTKVDAVDGEMAELAEEDVRETVEGTFLEGAPILHVSALEGTGMDSLREHLMSMATLAEPRQSMGVFRMPVQRVFSARGFGTIVTGIPVTGALKVGEVVELLPSGQKGKVRGIQAYHEATEVARAGHSTALNIADIDHHEVHRGDVVATPGFFKPQTMVGARLKALHTLSISVANRMQVRVHTGTADALGELVLLDADELKAGEEGLVQFRMETPLVCAPGDPFVVRLASPAITLGGGVILEESRYRLKRFKTFIIDELERQAASLGSTSALLEAMLVRSPERWSSVEDLALGVKRPRAETEGLLQEMQGEGKVVDLGKSKWIHAETLGLCLEELTESMGGWFAENPLRARMDIRDLRARMKLDPTLVGVLLEREEQDGRVVLSAGGFLAPAGRKIELDPEVSRLQGGVLQRLKEARFQPPSPDELAQSLGAAREAIDTILKLGVDEGSLTHIGAELYLSGEVVEEARQAVVANCEKNGHLEIPELRDAIGTTRKFLIPILEQFDTEGLTLRQAGRRVLKKR